LKPTGASRYVLRLPRSSRLEIEEAARNGYPDEVCGLLIGARRNGETVVERVAAARNLNTERSRDRYVLDPDDFLRADREAAEQGREVVGIWHSHPDHPPRPSRTDLEAAWPAYSYLIVSVAVGRIEALRSWRLADERFEEERLET
jgi:proteasome lid subunit RPN8/RPN11